MVKKGYIIQIVLLALSTTITSCSTFDFGGLIAAGSSVNERFEYSITQEGKASQKQEVVVNGDTYSFNIATDLHLKESQWKLMEQFMQTTTQNNNTLLVLLGDYLNEAGASLQPFGNLLANYPSLSTFTVIGNHEVYKRGFQESYKSVFGATCYSFSVSTTNQKDLFVIFDSANGTVGKGQFKWLKELLQSQRDNYRHCFICTHAHFFQPSDKIDFISTYTMEEQLELMNIFEKNRITAVFTGHSHSHDETTVRGIKYITLDPLFKDDNGEYAQIKCTKDGNIAIEFKKLSGDKI